MKKLEAATLLIGVALVTLSLMAVDWRLGVVLLGILLILSALELRPRRRA